MTNNFEIAKHDNINFLKKELIKLNQCVNNLFVVKSTEHDINVRRELEKHIIKGQAELFEQREMIIKLESFK